MRVWRYRGFVQAIVVKVGFIKQETVIAIRETSRLRTRTVHFFLPGGKLANPIRPLQRPYRTNMTIAHNLVETHRYARSTGQGLTGPDGKIRKNGVDSRPQSGWIR